jgi:adenosylhomocysteine nucleosidase
MIGIQSALEIEIELIRERLCQAKTQHSGGVEYVTGTIGQNEIVLAAGGIGSKRAASCAQFLIELFHVESIVFCGVAGRINPRLKVGDIVISREVVQYDQVAEATRAISENSASRSGTRIRADEDLVHLVQKACAETVGDDCCVTGTILTGDRPVLSQGRRTRLLRIYGGDCVEMEGAAVGSVCVANSVPFVVVRAISDRAGTFAPLEFKRNVRASARRVQEVVLRLLSLPTS